MTQKIVHRPLPYQEEEVKEGYACGEYHLTERFNPNNRELNKRRFQEANSHIFRGTKGKRPAGARFEKEELSFSLPQEEVNLGFVDSLSDQINLFETAKKTENDIPKNKSNQGGKTDLERILDLDEEDHESSVEYLGTGLVVPVTAPPKAKRLKTNEFETGL